MKALIGQVSWKGDQPRCPRCQAILLHFDSKWYCDSCKEVVAMETGTKIIQKKWCPRCQTYEYFNQGKCPRCQQD